METAQGMIECIGNRAAAQAAAFAADAMTIGDFVGAMLWLDVRRQIRTLLRQETSPTSATERQFRSRLS